MGQGRVSPESYRLRQALPIGTSLWWDGTQGIQGKDIWALCKAYYGIFVGGTKGREGKGHGLGRNRHGKIKRKGIKKAIWGSAEAGQCNLSFLIIKLNFWLFLLCANACMGCLSPRNWSRTTSQREHVSVLPRAEHIRLYVSLCDC